ncbi:MAG: hypothetical protein IPM79_31935 [Polyangiaceae bacterium]|jgi:hypothetical protein|nr:hypothetical protein [Polyangiaceae bacterium]
MKSPVLSKVLLLCGFAALAAAPGCGEEEDPTTSDEQDATSTIDDAFAKTLLTGGCSIKVVKTGKTQKTKGTGGACPTSVTAVLDAIDAAKLKTNVYVVSEQGDVTPGADTPYRFVMAVDTGDGKKEKLFLSMLGSGDGVSDSFLEIMSFNDKKGVYAYYDLEDGAWVQVGDGSQIKTDATSGSAPFRCASCHTTGQPLMKELHDSWANWHSTWFSMQDPKSSDALFNRLFSKKIIGDTLELEIIAGTKAATKARVDKAVKEKNLKPLVKQLMCDVGEPSLIASHSKSSSRVGTVSTFSSMLPTSILVNNLLKNPRTGTGDQKGLDNVVNMNIPSLSTIGQAIDSAAYVKALTTIGQTIGGQPGDAMFPMSSPEKSFADIQVVQELVARNLLDKDIIADVLMTDFTVSTFSSARCDLAATLPKTWTSVDELRTAWSTALTSSEVRGAVGLKARLDNKADLDAHAAKVETYVKACNDRARSTVQADKETFHVDLLKIMSQRRAEFVEKYEAVVESDWLVPSDNLNSVPHAIRLGATTCQLEDQTSPFLGESGE